MQEKIERYERWLRSYILSLRDIRNVGMTVFVVIILLVSWSGIKAIQTNYSLQKQISRLGQENQVQKLKDINLKLQNGYYSTDQYLEVTARENFGLGKPGETELLVPQNVALSYTMPMPGSKGKLAAPSPPFWQRNIEAWMKFLLHRDASN